MIHTAETGEKDEILLTFNSVIGESPITEWALLIPNFFLAARIFKTWRLSRKYNPHKSEHWQIRISPSHSKKPDTILWISVCRSDTEALLSAPPEPGKWLFPICGMLNHEQPPAVSRTPRLHLTPWNIKSSRTVELTQRLADAPLQLQTPGTDWTRNNSNNTKGVA